MKMRMSPGPSRRWMVTAWGMGWGQGGGRARGSDSGCTGEPVMRCEHGSQPCDVYSGRTGPPGHAVCTAGVRGIQAMRCSGVRLGAACKGCAAGRSIMLRTRRHGSPVPWVPVLRRYWVRTGTIVRTATVVQPGMLLAHPSCWCAGLRSFAPARRRPGGSATWPALC